MNISPIKKTELNTEVFQQMKKMLQSGYWKQGEKIPSENDLAKSFGVSRTTIRQALQKLTSLGLIETVQGKGRFVCVPDVGQIMQLLSPTVYLDFNSMRQVNDFREALEALSARLAAENCTEEDILELESNYSAMVECARKGKRREFAILDMEFHIKIGEISRNSLVRRTYSILYELLHDSMIQIVERMGYIGLTYHRQLIDAITAHDAKAAESIARSHVENNRRFFE